MVVPLNEDTTAATGMKVIGDGAVNQYLVQDPAMFGSTSDTLRNLIRQGSGGVDSPYSWNGPSSEESRNSSVPYISNPHGPFSPQWNTGDSSAGFKQLGIKLPDYITVNAGALGKSSSVSVNLGNGRNYAGGGTVPVTTGASLVFGWIPSNYGLPNSERASNTDQFLGGGSYSAAACASGFSLGGNHAIGGDTAIEFGVGLGSPTPGINFGGNAGTGVTFPVLDSQKQP